MFTIIDGLILAGGRSSRMGQDKALIPIQGEPLLHRVGRVASGCCRQVWILSPWPERYRAVVDPEWRLLTEADPDRGPLCGFHQGLEQISRISDPPEWILLLACDLPYLQGEILKEWGGRLEHLPPDRLAVVPYRQHRWEPLCGWYRLACLAPLAAAIQQGQRSFQPWLNSISLEPIEITSEQPPWERMVWNCNTPADLTDLDISPEAHHVRAIADQAGVDPRVQALPVSAVADDQLDRSHRGKISGTDPGLDR